MAFSCIFIAAALLTAATAVDIPEFLHVCKRNDPNLNQCITESVEHLQPYLKTGLPEHHIPTLEPLLLKEIVAVEGNGGIRISAKDIKAYGASDYTISNVKADVDTWNFSFDIGLKHLYIDGEYDIDGRLLVLPVTGNGRITGNFTDCSGAVKFTAFKKMIDGKEYFRVKEFSLHISVTKGTLQLDNLFGGDKVIGDVINNAINKSFDLILKEIAPLLDAALADVFIEIGTSVVEPYTFDQLFPL